ncbi:MAG: hypothetical protein J7639_12700 [Paenibacillaceae bacterium]|nr:hypothetical protein [Paenibacillaceae bacterium]
MMMKTKEGKVVEILFKDESGVCLCDDGWKRMLQDMTLPTLEEVKRKRQEIEQAKGSGE